MRLSDDEARARLAASGHGVLSTVHPDRGVDAVPVVYALDDGWIGVPVDTVKPKSSTRLQRVRNLETDPRAALLIEHWDPEDWSRLWWVRAELRFEGAPGSDRTTGLAARLADRFPQYRDQPFARIIGLRVVGLCGWAAATG